MAVRLDARSQLRLPVEVARPRWEPREHGEGHVHLGIGAFHRAHQAVLSDTAMAEAGGDWRICGVSLRSPDVRDRLQPQDCRYLVAERSAAGERLRLVASVARVLVAPEEPAAVLDALSRPGVRLVSLTVTEKGYGRDPAGGGLDAGRPDIAADLARPAAPATAPGFLVEALARRRAAGVAPPALLSCDNLSDNGATLRSVLVAMAEARGDAALARHIAEDVPIPSSMVDRIVPATTCEDRAAVTAATGLDDRALVVTEPFCQWVVEEFDAPRPAWERAGVLFVPSVRPFELMKLRLLNGSHTTLACLGRLAGWETVDEAVAQPLVRGVVHRLMDAAQATLPPAPGLDLKRYRADLMARFANPALRHRTAQIVVDTSQKLPQRLVAPAREAVAAGRDPGPLALGIGAWLAFLVRAARAGQPVDDALAAPLIARAAGPEPLAALLGFEPVFGDAGADPGFAGPVKDAARRLIERPVTTVLAAELAGEAA